MVRDPRAVLNPDHVSRCPPCFDSAEQYREWQKLKRLSYQWQGQQGVCFDCTPEYKEKMMCEGRCQHPETVFVTYIDKYHEAETVGINKLARWYKRVMAGQMVFVRQNGDDDAED